MGEYDVLIYELSTGKVEEVIGPYPENGFYNIYKMETGIASRLNEDYATKVVKSGTVSKDEVLTDYDS